VAALGQPSASRRIAPTTRRCNAILSHLLCDVCAMLIPLEAEVEFFHASAAAFLRLQSSSLCDHQHSAGRDRARLFDSERFKRKFVTTLADLRGELGFRIGGDDAKTLKREFATIQPASSFQDLSNSKTFVRTMSAEPGRPGHPQGPIALKTFPAFGCQGTENAKARVIETSLRRHSRPRAEVDASLNRFLSPA